MQLYRSLHTCSICFWQPPITVVSVNSSPLHLDGKHEPPRTSCDVRSPRCHDCSRASSITGGIANVHCKSPVKSAEGSSKNTFVIADYLTESESTNANCGKCNRVITLKSPHTSGNEVCSWRALINSRCANGTGSHKVAYNLIFVYKDQHALPE